MLHRLASSVHKLSFRVNNRRILRHLLNRNTNRQLVARQNRNHGANGHTLGFAGILNRTFNSRIRRVTKSFQPIRQNSRTGGNSSNLRVQQFSICNRTKFRTQSRSDLRALRVLKHRVKDGSGALVYLV